jgi:Carboxypeptidase regulatory-like domain/TonB dependent receptor
MNFRRRLGVPKNEKASHVPARRTSVKIFVCVAVSMLLAIPFYAQTTNGSIQGQVTDPSGAVLGGATVTARNMDTGITVTAHSTDAGVYSLPDLRPGRYSIVVEAANLKKYQQDGVTVRTASTTALNIQMQIGSVSESVTVSADAAQLETATSDIGATVETSLVQNLPLEVSGTIRNPVQFITLVPGFVGNVGNDPGSNSTDDFKVNGGQEGGTDILVDGVSISLVSPNTQWNKGVSTEAVQEFKVLQSNFSAEFGESGDGIVNLTLKSGTNQFHGSAYDYLRNRALDANSWEFDVENSFNRANNLKLNPKPPDTQNDFGFTVGGPVFLPHLYNGKNKTFFFFDYEGFRFRTGSSGTTSYVPEAFRNGDFSALLASGVQLYDPTTHNPIPGNILTNDPNFTPSSVITNVFALLPPTNGGLTDNVFDQSLSSTTANLWDLKIDHNISDKQRFSFGFDYDNTNTGGTSVLAPFLGSHTPQNTRYARFSHNYILNPTFVNQFLFGFSRRFRTEASNGLDEGWPQKLGLTGVANTTFPCIKFTDTPYQDRLNNCGASQFADNVYQVNDSVSLVRGKHSFKFGGEVRLLQFNVRRLTQSSGEFDFNAKETSLNGSGGNAVASALFGLVNTGVLNYGRFSGVRYKSFSFYGQDTYKLTPRLTLNYGLRYDIDRPAREAQDRFSAVDPNLPNPGAGGIPGAYTYFGSGPGRNGQTRLQDTYTKAFGPRLGFAYSINDKTVLRGGYGIFYQPLKEGSFADQDSLGFFNLENLSVGNGAPFQIDNGFPHILPPSGPFTPEGQNGNSGVILIPRNSGRPADIQSWNLDVQRQITTNLQVSVAYVGSKGTHLPALNIIPNQVNPRFLSLGNDLTMDVSCLGAGTCPNAIAAGVHIPYAGFTGNINQALRPFPQYGDFNQEDNSFTPDRTGNSTYHAMQAQVTKRFAQGLNFLVSYTVSKNITDADSAGPGVSGFIGTNSFIGQNSYDRRAEKAVSQLDTPQSLVASFFYELPVGRGKPFLNTKSWANHIVGGWSVSGILSYQSGLPTEVYAPCGATAGDVLFAGCHFTGMARANVIPGVRQTNGSDLNPFTTPFFNANAFSKPADFTFGNEPRSLASARSFGGRNENITIGKKTNIIGERAVIDFRAEFFNIFNRHILQQPGGAGGFATTLGSPPFAAAGSGTDCPGPFACGFGAVTHSSGPRTIQFGLKISY